MKRCSKDPQRHHPWRDSPGRPQRPPCRAAGPSWVTPARVPKWGCHPERGVPCTSRSTRALGWVPVSLQRGHPRARTSTPPPRAAHFRGWARGEAPAGHRLTQAVGRGQQQEEQREHGASAWVPRAECGRRVGDARVVPAGPACGLQPPTFLRQPRPRGKQVGPVSPGSICYAWAPAGRRAENGHARGRGVPQPAPRGGTRFDPQPQHPHQGPPLSGSGTPPFSFALWPPGEQSAKLVREQRAPRGRPGGVPARKDEEGRPCYEFTRQRTDREAAGQSSSLPTCSTRSRGAGAGRERCGGSCRTAG